MRSLSLVILLASLVVPETLAASCGATTFQPATPHLMAGLYPNGTLTGGVAFYVAPEASFGAQPVYADFQADPINGNQSAHLVVLQVPLPPSTALSITWFILAGNWSTALNFAMQN